MNFKRSFLEGQKARNKGIPLGSEGLEALSRAIGGLQKARIYSLGAAPKVGKSTLADIGFVIGPCMYVLRQQEAINLKIANLKQDLLTQSDSSDKINAEILQWEAKKLHLEIIYFSFEIDRVTKEFDFVTHFLHEEYGIETVKLPEHRTYKGKNEIELSPDFLRGLLTYDDNPEEVITVPAEMVEQIKTIYLTRIIPLFGEYDESNKLTKKGMIRFIEHRENPTGLRNLLLDYAKKRGNIVYESYKVDNKIHKKMVAYKPFNENLLTLVVCDHVRKLLRERGFSMKDVIDKWSEYAVEMRDLFKFSFLHISHINRNLTDTKRRDLDDDRLFPTSDDFKDSSNLAEDSNYVITMFNPTDDRYNLSKHFGIIIRRTNKTIIYPKFRTVHLVDSRNVEAPQHFSLNMWGNLKTFKKFEKLNG
jgi:hypothetical protein